MNRSMAMTEKQVRWKTTDGKEFDNPEDAIRHEKLSEAQQRLDEATRAWARAVGEYQKTADGVPFEWNRSQYWRVSRWHGGWPTVVSVDGPWLHHAEIDERDHAVVTEDRWTDGQGQRIETRISELYFHHRNAAEAALEAQAERLREFAKQHAELAQQHGLRPLVEVSPVGHDAETESGAPQ